MPARVSGFKVVKTDTLISAVMCCVIRKAIYIRNFLLVLFLFPIRFKHPPVILFSIDGFKAEYLYREKTPYIWKLGMNSSR